MSEPAWTIPGAEGEAIFGNTHTSAAAGNLPRGVVLIAHGFKGYKDYGMFPRTAREFARAGFIAHRFNFSHSGMTNVLETFVRPDLFERDTWNRQVFDLRAVAEAVARGELEGGSLPLVLLGHSRGGVTVILTAGRFADDNTFPQPAGIITLAAPSKSNSLTDEQTRELFTQGWLESASARTGQKLRVGRAFVQEQLDDPDAHDVLALAGRITCPMLVIHGSDDGAVPPEASHQITQAARHAHRLEIAGANHVFNTPNPLRDDAELSDALRRVIDASITFARQVCM